MAGTDQPLSMFNGGMEAITCTTEVSMNVQTTKETTAGTTSAKEETVHVYMCCLYLVCLLCLLNVVCSDDNGG